MKSLDVPEIPKVRLGRSAIISTRLGLGCAVWPLLRSYDQVVEILRAALSVGIRHIDAAPLYGTEEIVGRALHDIGIPDDLILATKVCSYQDTLGIVYREYSDRTAYRSVERSLKRLKVNQLDIVHIHDATPVDLESIFSRNGALRALLDLQRQGLVRSIGMATQWLPCLKIAVQSGDFDHIQAYHSYTLLNQELEAEVLPSARHRNVSVLNSAPYAGWILSTGAVSGACYNYKPASSAVVEAVQRIELLCAEEGVSLSEAALAFSLLSPHIDVTLVGASSPERLYQRVRTFSSQLSRDDLAKMSAMAQGPHALHAPYPANPTNVRPYTDHDSSH